MDLTTGALRISSRFSLCMLSITYSHHNPTTTPARRSPTHTLSNSCESRVRPRRERLSNLPGAIECERLSPLSCSGDGLRSGGDPGEHANELPDALSDSLGRNSLLLQKRFVAAAVRAAAPDRRGGERAGCGAPGLLWLHRVCGCEDGWMCRQVL